MLVVVLVSAGAACSAGDQASTTTRKATTTAPHYGAHAGMAPEPATVADIAKLGPGPSVGQTVSGFVGVDVCGRFLALPTPAPSSTAGGTGVAFPGEGRFSITPTDERSAGHAATVGSIADALGVELSDGTVTFDHAAYPAQIEVAGTTVEVAGKTFGPELRCGDTPAELQLWVYPATAVDSGEGLRSVVKDVADVPVVEDGMAFVIAVAPESSLPTLPPSALAR